MHLLAGQKMLEDEYKDHNVLCKVNKANMARRIEAIKEYQTSHCGVMRVPLAYIIRKTMS